MSKHVDISRDSIPHACPIAVDPDWSGYGKAINTDEIVEQPDGSLWAGNDEYGTRVNFCPFCGYKAKVPIP